MVNPAVPEAALHAVWNQRAETSDDVVITIVYTNDIHACNSYNEYNRTIGFENKNK